ncbi:MAG: [protein-PII] uridylyltransferase [Hyphomonadaceae bacterium]|nr:[protein-PII] uridylyltransferase [Hyphomonadaceae bacterium]
MTDAPREAPDERAIGDMPPTQRSGATKPGPWRIADIVDGRKLRIQLTAAALDNGSDPAAQRARALDLIHAALFRGRMIAQDRLEEGADGLDTAALLSAVMDQALSALYDFTVVHIFRAHNPTEAERMSVLAVGGYGRSVLAPSSDVDLLFVRNYKQTAWAESVIEYMLYALWDMGLKVGHAFRTIDECIKLSREDVTIRTSILDQRFLFGDKGVAEKLVERFQKDVIAGRGAEFVAAKLEERNERHAREGDSRYRVEPNVKDGKGGLRDLQTLFWLAKYIHGGRTLVEVLDNAAFTPADKAVFLREARFLWTVRCHLHFLTGRPEERLSFDLQPEMATRMGYTARQNVTAVERFMKRYFLAAKEVGALTRILCAKLEIDEKKRPGGRPRLIPAAAAKPLKEEGFAIDGGRITITDPDMFVADTRKLMRLFWLANERHSDIHPEAMTAARRSLWAVTRQARTDDDSRAMFLDIITGKNTDNRTLPLMNEAGVLGRFVPEFGRIVGQTQFNMYHHFTVDEHTLKAVETIHDIERGLFKDAHPLSTELFPKIQNRRALYLAMLLHDTGKGKGDQQIEGAKQARSASLRLGLAEDEAELVAWLVGNHLEMSDTAQRRDISDPQTISKFADRVGNLERLRLLLILTVADIRAVGPGVWNGWKGQLLRDLYYATEAALRGSRTDETSVRAQLADRAEAARTALAKRIGPAPALADVEDAYWVGFTLDAQARHAAALAVSNQPITVASNIDSGKSATEILVSAPDRPGLFADLCGALSAAGANIVAAHLYENGDSRVLDVFDVQDSRGQPIGADHPHALARLMDDLRAAAAGGEGVKRPGKAPAASRRHAAFIISPLILIDREASSASTVIEVSGRDRAGLLYDIARELADAGLSIRSAHVGAYGPSVHDVFYVEMLDGGGMPPEMDEPLTKRLVDVLRSHAPTAPRIPAHTLARAPVSFDR